MCGIAVILNGDTNEINRMTSAISKRGITWQTERIGSFETGFVYLPITNKAAKIQPYRINNTAVLFNGFISNYTDLAKKYKIETTDGTDTEVVSKLIDLYGIEITNEFNGFFAIVVIRDGNKLSYAVDRYGIKQLYTYQHEDKFYICSEIKGILAAVSGIEFNQGCVDDYLSTLGVMDISGTIYTGIKKVVNYYTPQISNINIPFSEAKDRLEVIFSRAIERNYTKDHVTGVFLSGGIDSGILAKRIQPDYLLSMDYENLDYSEIDNIKENANGLSSIHLTMICNRRMKEMYSKQAALALDDPRVGSCYTNYALTELAAKNNIRVLYSGAGSDELFYGYSHRYDKPIEQVIKRTDKPIKKHDITHTEYDFNFLRGILTVEDRMSGAFAIETRYPFLDNEVVDFVLSLPFEYRRNKLILKAISGLSKRVLTSKKKGFSNPHFTNAEWSEYVIATKLETIKNDRLVR